MYKYFQFETKVFLPGLAYDLPTLHYLGICLMKMISLNTDQFEVLGPSLFNLTFNPGVSEFLLAPNCRWKLYNKRKYKYKINHSYNLAPSFCVIAETDQPRLLIGDIGLYDDGLHQSWVFLPPGPRRKLNLYKIFIR